MLTRSTRSLASATSRLSQVSHQLNRQVIHQQQSRMASTTHFTLNTGAKIPAIGFGTWQDKDAQENAVEIAIKAGYRHIDTARVYGTEAAVARGIKSAGVPRGELFITTKLWNNSHHPDDVEPALDASLKDLGTDYVDLYLMVRPILRFLFWYTMLTFTSTGQVHLQRVIVYSPRIRMARSRPEKPTMSKHIKPWKQSTRKAKPRRLESPTSVKMSLNVF